MYVQHPNQWNIPCDSLKMDYLQKPSRTRIGEKKHIKHMAILAIFAVVNLGTIINRLIISTQDFGGELAK